MPPITVRKKYGYTASVIQGSDKITACAKADWSNIRDNSFILIDGDKVFYQIIDKRKYTYKTSVSVVNDTQIKIHDNVGTTLGTDDDISFRSPEYNVSTVNVNDGGDGYVIGDILKPEGGVCKYNSLDEIDITAEFEVTEVNNSGKVLSLKLVNEGKYNIAPSDSCALWGGSGSGASCTISTSLSNTISSEERGVSLVELSDNETIIHLNHPLPPKIESGEIEVNKWELTINRNYVGESKLSAGYDIIKDFTPNLDLPLLHKEIIMSHLLYNESVIKIDEKIKNLENEIESLKGQLGP
jgi:hypothetical protein